MRKITVREAINEAISESMSKDNNIIILGEDIAEYNGAYKVTEGLLSKFGKDRVIDTPISEHAFAGIAVGAAFAGLRPIVEFMTFNFAVQALDHIINSAAKTLYMSASQVTTPIVFRGPNGSASRVAAQHSHNYAALYSNIPGLKLICPYDAEDHKLLLKQAIKDNNPVVFLENEILYGDKFEIDDDIINNDIDQIGKAKIMKSGKDITIVSFSIQLSLVIEAAEKLKKLFNIDVEIINLRTIKPFDKETIINSVKKTSRLLVVEEGWFFSGIAATITSIVTQEAFDYLDAEPMSLSAEDTLLPYAANLEKLALPSVNKIIELVKYLCNK